MLRVLEEEVGGIGLGKENFVEEFGEQKGSDGEGEAMPRNMFEDERGKPR